MDTKPVTPKVRDPRKTVEPGTVINERYQIVKFIGRGGFATVYQAKQLLIDRQVAIKLLSIPNSVKDVDKFQMRFVQEAKVAAQIRHPNVVTIHDFGFTKEGQPYIAMELLEGHDLETELSTRGPLEAARALRLVSGVLDALGEGHEKGVIHKDLKPANLFITDPGTPKEMMKVLDFGVARLETEEQGRMTDTGEFAGTPGYAAPEYLETQIATPALDVYQMGLILVEMLTGVPVVASDNPIQCIFKHINAELDIPPELLRGAFGAIISKAVARDHTQRYQNGTLFSAALKSSDSSAVSSAVLPVVKQSGRDERAHLATLDVEALSLDSGDLETARAGDVGFAPTYSGGKGEPPSPMPDSAVRRSAVLAEASPVVSSEPRPSLESSPVSTTVAPKPPLVWISLGLLAAVLVAGVILLQSFDSASTSNTTPKDGAVAAADTGETARTSGATAEDIAEALPADVVASSVDGASVVVEVIPDVSETTSEPLRFAVRVESEPAGAEVFVDDIAKGKTPADLEFTDTALHALELRLAGFQPDKLQLQPDASEALRRVLTPIETPKVSDVSDRERKRLEREEKKRLARETKAREKPKETPKEDGNPNPTLIIVQ